MIRKKPLGQRFLNKIQIRYNTYVHTYTTRNFIQVYSFIINVIVIVINYYQYQFWHNIVILILILTP